MVIYGHPTCHTTTGAMLYASLRSMLDRTHVCYTVCYHSTVTTPEGDIQRKILQHLKKQGVYCWRNNTTGIYDQKLKTYRTSPYALKGVADILGILPDGKLLAIEVKTKKGVVSQDQALFGRRIRENNGVYIIARSVSDVSDALAVTISQ